MHYTEEKVLYFANREAGLHVRASDMRGSGTTLSGLVHDLKIKKLIYSFCVTDEGEFFKTTLDGDIRLLKLQIKWRSSAGKDTAEHEERLNQLQSQKRLASN